MVVIETMGKDEDAWIMAVRESYLPDPRPANSNEILIHRVPKSLLNKKTEGFYVPQVMPIGPYHFQVRWDDQRDDMESLKTAVSRKIHKILTKRVDANGLLVDANGLRSVIDNFNNGEGIHEKIKDSYVTEFWIDREVWAYMIARDACFLVEVLHRFSEGDGIKEKEPVLRIDSILDRKRHHPLLNEIVKDMFKMENQLPFWTLLKINAYEKMEKENWFESPLRNLSPIEVTPVPGRKYEGKYILQLLHEYIVDKRVLDRTTAIKKNPPLLSCAVSPLSLIWKAVIGILILLFFPFFIIWLIWHWLMLRSKSYRYIKRRDSVLSAEELKRVGVKFKSLGTRGISHINFNINNSKMYLPKFKVDDRSEAMLRNLMALEICSEQKEKPVTRYVILMNDLINTSTDVAILRQKDIITHKLGSDDEVAQLWNSILVSSSTVVPYHPIDDAASQINLYTKKWWRVLWAQFQMAHCSKPWLVVSLLGGISLLLLTIVQVACLFHSCLLG